MFFCFFRTLYWTAAIGVQNTGLVGETRVDIKRPTGFSDSEAGLGLGNRQQLCAEHDFASMLERTDCQAHPRQELQCLHQKALSDGRGCL